jgi:Tfp pilus assembly protein PilV
MKDYLSKNKRQRQQGFTLIETSVALVVMMIGGLGIAAVFAYAIRNNTGARDRAAALAVAQQELEILRHLSYSDPALTATVNPITRETTSAGRSYSIRTNIQDTTATVKTIDIQVTPLSSSNPFLSTVTVTTQRAAFSLGAYSGGP